MGRSGIWVPIEKSNFVLDLQKKKKNPIFHISVDILQNTNFFRAFTASASLDETRFILDANLLREALEITPIDQAHQFMSPSLSDAIKDFVNELEYTEARLLGMIGTDTLFFLDALGHNNNPTKKDRKDKPHVIPYCRFTKLIICHLGRKHNIHQRSTSPFHLAEEDLTLGNLKFIPKGEEDEHDRKIAAEKGEKKKPATAKQLKQKSAKEKSSKPAPAPKPKDDTSINIICDSPSPMDAEIGADTDKTNSGGDTKILQIGEEQGDDVANVVNLDEKTGEIDEGQARPDPGKTPKPRPLLGDDKMDEDQAGPNPRESCVALAGPNHEPTHEEFMANVYPNVHESLKFPANEHVISEEPLSLSRTLSLMKNLDYAYTIGDQFLNDKSTEDEPDRFKELPEANMKEILHQRMFESGAYKSLPEHVALYEALEASIERANRDEFLAKKDKSRNRCRNNQDPPPPPLDSDLSKKKRHDSDPSGSSQPLTSQSSAWKTYDTKEAPSSSFKKQSGPYPEQLVKDMPMPDTAHISDSKDTDSAHLPKIKLGPEWLKPILEEDRPATPEPDWVILPNELPEPENNWANALANSFKDPGENTLLRKTGDMGSFITWFCKRIGKKKLSKSDLEVPTFKDLEYLVLGEKGRRSALSISKLKAAQYLNFGLEELVLSLWIESECEYDISVAYCISHWWFKRNEFYITRHSAPSDRNNVLRKVDYKEYKISEADYKNLHLNDFEDLYLLHLQDWDASNFLFKEDYTIVSKPRAVIYRDRNYQKMMMRETEVHKFNDGTLNRILDKLDHMVKDFKLYEYNPGMETRI
ncbi:hypothetical protein Tco_1110035 [Tanacetum coccineum]|uniref:Uncharacterized protein n=1 Tax=Tanacetum coccineum TaxID=301880 RepID=A0ABQ5IHN5_9ASTR